MNEQLSTYAGNSNYLDFTNPNPVPDCFSIDDLYESVEQSQSLEGCFSSSKTLYAKLNDPSCACTSKYCNEFYNTCQKLAALFSRKIWCVAECPKAKLFNDMNAIKMAKKLIGIAESKQYTKENVYKACRRLLAQNHPDITRKSVEDTWFSISEACNLLKTDVKIQNKGFLTRVYEKFIKWIL